MSEKKVGLVGLGAMGLGMAKSLQRAGYRVHVFDVRREVAESFAAEGGVVCDSPAEVAAFCEVVISVVVNAAQTEAVLFGDGGAASEPPLQRLSVVQHATTGLQPADGFAAVGQSPERVMR